jgi:hypothetical protein
MLNLSKLFRAGHGGHFRDNVPLRSAFFDLGLSSDLKVEIAVDSDCNPLFRSRIELRFKTRDSSRLGLQLEIAFDSDCI